MSFILDALRKSEQDRQRGRVPDIAQTGMAPRQRSRSVWLPVVGLLVGLNISLLAVLWLMNAADPVPPPAPPPEPAATPPAPSQPVRPSGLRADAARSLSSELETAAPRRAPPRATPAQPQVVVSPVTMSRAVPAPEADIDYPPTLTELLLDGSINLEPLHMDLHVYSANPAQRFVFINNARYREGERLAAGPAVEQITDIGVILSYQGREFLLTRD
ncbi:MAG: general secretion pathway protein GspB [Gammaproteobacteria bacterium]|jgi:general secretion pathway protein B|nr:general secretion pathway protein GspB [Gammaproteobacteria bacterium]